MIAYRVRGWLGDQLDWQARDRLLVLHDVMWDGEEVRFCGVDREWLREIGVIA